MMGRKFSTTGNKFENHTYNIDRPDEISAGSAERGERWRMLGVLANKFRLFHTKLAVHPDFAIDIVQAACILHNLCLRGKKRS
jgi:hypothetical protein